MLRRYLRTGKVCAAAYYSLACTWSSSVKISTNSTPKYIHQPNNKQRYRFIMSWRSQGITGSNNIPLGNRRRFGGEGEDSQSPPPRDSAYGSPAPSAGVDSGFKRGRSPVRGVFSQNKISTSRNFHTDTRSEPAADDGSRRRKKRNRWGDATENKAAGLMGLPTAILANMTSEQLEAYTLHLRIEEITQKLKIDDVVPADGDRCVIPPFLRQRNADAG